MPSKNKLIIYSAAPAESFTEEGTVHNVWGRINLTYLRWLFQDEELNYHVGDIVDWQAGTFSITSVGEEVFVGKQKIIYRQINMVRNRDDEHTKQEYIEWENRVSELVDSRRAEADENYRVILDKKRKDKEQVKLKNEIRKKNRLDKKAKLQDQEEKYAAKCATPFGGIEL